MQSFEEIKEKIIKIDENTSLEEMRNTIADVVEAIPTVTSDITGLTDRVSELQTEVANRDAEIERLKTENGKLFRERVSKIVDESEDEKEKEVTEDEYTRDELEKMFREMP